MNALFLSCLKATTLIEKKLDVRLSIKERWQLRMHKMMCSGCTQYETQSMLIHQGLKKSEQSSFTKQDLEVLKHRIYKKLERLK